MPSEFSTRPCITESDGWPAEWETFPADFGRGTFRIDVDGHWYHDGVRVTHPALVRLFASHVYPGSNGDYVLRWGPYEHPVAVADTPAVVRRVRAVQALDAAVDADLVDDRRVALPAGDLWVGPAHVFYGRMPDGAPVRFSRAAYHQVAQWIEPEGDGFVLAANGRRWPIRAESGA